jgi:DNA-binding Lrp family transcriptional regulator
MKNKEMLLLSELIKNSKRSDRDLAKILRVSQPTASRMRQRLQSTGMIQEYTVMPDFEKLGYELMAFWIVTYKWRGEPELQEKWREWMKQHPNIIFAANAFGIRGSNALMISFHKNYSDYTLFGKELVRDWSYIMEHETMLVDLKGYMSRPLTFRYLAEQTAELSHL